MSDRRPAGTEASQPGAPPREGPRPQPKVLTIAEVAAYLRISRGSAYEAARRGDLPTLRLGRRLLVPRVALEALLEQTATTVAREVSDER